MVCGLWRPELGASFGEAGGCEKRQHPGSYPSFASFTVCHRGRDNICENPLTILLFTVKVNHKTFQDVAWTLGFVVLVVWTLTTSEGLSCHAATRVNTNKQWADHLTLTHDWMKRPHLIWLDWIAWPNKNWPGCLSAGAFSLHYCDSRPACCVELHQEEADNWGAK